MAVESIGAPFPWQYAQWQQLSRAFAAKTLAHAYLLSGSEGLGKLLFAEGFARLALCLSPVETNAKLRIACGDCSNCRKGGVGNHPDIIRIGTEEGSKNIKVDQIRWLSEFVIRSSHSGGAKIAIIDQAHLLNSNAANALLKTLEEPNDNTHLLLVSDHPGRLVATIRSRCQKLLFSTPDPDTAINWLQQNIAGANAQSLLSSSEGRPLTALSLAEGDALQVRSQFLQSLYEMKSGRRSIQQVLALASKAGESEVLQHFSMFLTKLTKYSLTGINDSEEDSALESMFALVPQPGSGQGNHVAASALSHFYIEVETARRQLSSSTNPNPQLIMESLLWRWSRLNLGSN